MQMRNIFLRATAYLTLVTFTFSNVAWSASAPPVTDVTLPSLAQRIEIPSSLGIIRNRYMARDPESKTPSLAPVAGKTRR